MLCQPALLPGEVCHPSRFNWTTYSSNSYCMKRWLLVAIFAHMLCHVNHQKLAITTIHARKDTLVDISHTCLVMRLVLVCSVIIYILSYPLAYVLPPDVECVTFRQETHIFDWMANAFHAPLYHVVASWYGIFLPLWSHRNVFLESCESICLSFQ